MSTSEKKKRRPLRKLVFLAALAGIVVAIKNALADKGGSYEAPATTFQVPTPPAAPAAPSSVRTAEHYVAQRPVENLNEFADPVPATPATTAAAEVPEPAVKPAVDGTPEPSKAAAEDAYEAEATREDIAATKIDPFGIR